MAFQPFNLLKNLLNPISSRAKSAVNSVTSAASNVINTAGVVDFVASGARYLNSSAEKTGLFLQYPIEERDQEHYILIDIIERVKDDKGGKGELVYSGPTLQRDDLTQIVFGANRFFGEGDYGGLVPTGIGSKRKVKNTVAIYMPQTVKFQFAADYGAAEVGNLIGVSSKLREAFLGEGNSKNLIAAGMQFSKLIEGGVDFFSLGQATGLGALAQRRTNIAPAAMTEMIFNGIDYRSFSFDFKFTPRNKRESDLVRTILDVIKSSMLPRKYSSGSIAAYTVPDEFAIRFMKGMNINPYLDQIGLCACTGVDITYGGDKFSTHAHGDPVTIDATISFRELELVERDRYQTLRDSARGSQADIGDGL